MKPFVITLLAYMMVWPFSLPATVSVASSEIKREALAGPTAHTIVSEADAQVNSDAPDKNYGIWTTLRINGGDEPEVRSYLRFSLTALSGSIQSAQVRLYALSGTKDGPTMRAADSTWSEAGITWNNRPPATSAVADDQGPVAAGSWVTFDATQLVTDTGTYSFLLQTTSTDGLAFASRNHPDPALHPQLVVGFSSRHPTDDDQVILAAGDIASCSSIGDEATANLLDGEVGTVVTVGDNVYEDGTYREFVNCYEPSWGRHKSRTRPAPGNHEYRTAGAQGYFDYFGAAAGDRTKGYYSYNLGSWHIVVLNSHCSAVGGCGVGSPQEQWLRADLASHPSTCTLAYWHTPRWSSGNHGSSVAMQPFWQALYEAGVEVVLSGHDHHYERFAPQDPAGQIDSERGVREFIVGMGGKSLYSLPTILPNSEKQNADTFGILKLTLQPTQYQWRFIPEAGKTFTDTGTTACH